MTYPVADRKLQLLISIHEQMHHELHWSTAWGVTAAMSGLLADAGVDQERFRAVAGAVNVACRRVHELFATTMSCGVVGVPLARELLAPNARYLGYLTDGLRLGGPESAAPWQFRESAIQMLLRVLMQPAELASVAERGLERLRVRDVADPRLHPDHRLRAVAGEAGDWWEGTFAELLREHPDRGGDVGGRWERVLPDDEEAMDRMKAWEETVLIPALQEAATARLRAAGFAVLDQAEYLDVVDRLRASFLALGPAGWEVEVFTERRRLRQEPLGAEREGMRLHRAPARLAICEPDELMEHAEEFIAHGPEGPHLVAAYLCREVVQRQFRGLEELPADGRFLGPWYRTLHPGPRPSAVAGERHARPGRESLGPRGPIQVTNPPISPTYPPVSGA